jgi:predicted N-acetyltransferase YhbS
MVTVRQERPAEAAAREALLDLAYGPVRFTKTSERLREGRLPELALVASEGRRIVGTVRVWQVLAGPNRPALLLGPLAVDPTCRKRGIGSTLVQHALREAARRQHGAVLLVGDAPYYGRFGFSSEKTDALWLPGPYERHRLLACELKPGALDGARGLISACGRPEQRPDLATLVAGLVRNDNTLTPRADEPGSGRVSGARTIESSRWPLASLASATRAA